jgi:hypothetical protein
MADIPINEVTRRVQFTGNTGTGPFAFTFNILADDDLVVYKNFVLQTITTDYTVSTNANGTGSITLTSALIASDVLTIIGGRALERTTDFVTAGDLLASSLNEQFDSLVIMAQQLDEKLDRSLKVDIGDQFTDLSLPAKANRVGKVMAFNATSGDPEAGPTIGDVSSIADITADIALLADIEDGTTATNAITNVNTIRTDVSTVSGVSANVTTVAGISANVTTVAGISANVTTVAGVSSEVATLGPIASDITTVSSNNTNVTTVASNINAVNTVASNIANVNTVANDLLEVVSEIETVANDLNEATSEIEVVANNIANVNTVGTISGNVTTVAGISADVTAVAADASDIGVVATNIVNVNAVGSVSANVTTVAGISADVTTVAGISADISTVANTDLTAVINNSANISTVGTNIASVNTVAADISSVTNVSNNISSVNSFSNQYTISATAPSSANEGLLWFDTSTDTMKVYNGSSFQNAGSSVNGTSSRGTFTATGGQTTFTTTGYDSGFIDIYLNGSKLVVGTDVTATNGTTFVLASGATAGDVVEYIAYGTFELTSVYTQSQSDARYAQLSGATFTGDVSGTNITLSGYLRGPSTFTIDPAAHGDNTGTLVIAGNLQVDGTTTTVNSTTMEVDDLNITVASGAVNAAAANGAGITVDGANATMTYNSTGDNWEFNKPINLGTWTVTESGGSLYFAVSGVNKMKLDASGNLDVVGNVNTNATIT